MDPLYRLQESVCNQWEKPNSSEIMHISLDYGLDENWIADMSSIGGGLRSEEKQKDAKDTMWICGISFIILEICKWNY